MCDDNADFDESISENCVSVKSRTASVVVIPDKLLVFYQIERDDITLPFCAKSHLVIHNPTDHDVIYKFKSNSSKPIVAVKPSSGIIAAGAHVDVDVTLAYECREEIDGLVLLVVTAPAPDNCTDYEDAKAMWQSIAKECLTITRLSCEVHVPSPSGRSSTCFYDNGGLTSAVENSSSRASPRKEIVKSSLEPKYSPACSGPKSPACSDPKSSVRSESKSQEPSQAEQRCTWTGSRSAKSPPKENCLIGSVMLEPETPELRECKFTKSPRYVSPQSSHRCATLSTRHDLTGSSPVTEHNVRPSCFRERKKPCEEPCSPDCFWESEPIFYKRHAGSDQHPKQRPRQQQPWSENCRQTTRHRPTVMSAPPKPPRTFRRSESQESYMEQQCFYKSPETPQWSERKYRSRSCETRPTHKRRMPKTTIRQTCPDEIKPRAGPKVAPKPRLRPSTANGGECVHHPDCHESSTVREGMKEPTYAHTHCCNGMGHRRSIRSGSTSRSRGCSPSPCVDNSASYGCAKASGFNGHDHYENPGRNVSDQRQTSYLVDVGSVLNQEKKVETNTSKVMDLANVLRMCLFVVAGIAFTQLFLIN